MILNIYTFCGRRYLLHFVAHFLPNVNKWFVSTSRFPNNDDLLKFLQRYFIDLLTFAIQHFASTLFNSIAALLCDFRCFRNLVGIDHRSYSFFFQYTIPHLGPNMSEATQIHRPVGNGFRSIGAMDFVIPEDSLCNILFVTINQRLPYLCRPLLTEDSYRGLSWASSSTRLRCRDHDAVTSQKRGSYLSAIAHNKMGKVVLKILVSMSCTPDRLLLPMFPNLLLNVWIYPKKSSIKGLLFSITRSNICCNLCLCYKIQIEIRDRVSILGILKWPPKIFSWSRVRNEFL